MRDIEFLEKTYNQLKTFGLVEDKQQFSIDLLGKSRSYMSSMSARGRQPSPQVLEHLRRVLTLWIGMFEAGSKPASPHRHEVELGQQRLIDVLQNVTDFLAVRAGELGASDETR